MAKNSSPNGYSEDVHVVSSTTSSSSLSERKLWVYKDENLEKDLSDMRSIIYQVTGHVEPEALSDPSKVRTEYRKMVAAKNIIAKAIDLQTQRFDWMNQTTMRNRQDEEILDQREAKVTDSVQEIRQSPILQSANITLSTQRAVQTIVEMRYDDLDGALDFDTVDYTKYCTISKLCSTALDSLTDLVDGTSKKQMQCTVAKRQLRAIRKEATSDSNILKTKLKTLPLFQLENICNAME